MHKRVKKIWKKKKMDCKCNNMNGKNIHGVLWLAEIVILIFLNLKTKKETIFNCSFLKLFISKVWIQNAILFRR